MKHHLACPLDFGLKIFHFSVTPQQAAWLPFQNLPQWSHAQLCRLKSPNQGVQFQFLTNACLYHQSLETYACQTLVTNKALSTTGHNGQIKQIPPPSLKYMVHTAFILCKCSDERGFQPEHDKTHCVHTAMVVTLPHWYKHGNPSQTKWWPTFSLRHSTKSLTYPLISWKKR